MPKDIYDKKGILKPECAWTESEKKAMIFNNDPQEIEKLDSNKVREMLYKKLKSMQDDVLKNKISFKMFEEYYNLLKSGILSGLLDKPLSFVLTLSDAVVMPIDNDEKKEKLQIYIEDLKNIIANEIRKSLDGDGIMLAQELTNMQKTISLYTITLQQYCSFCEKIRLAMMAKLDNVDYMECVRTLQNAKVEPTKTYDEHIRLHNYQKKLSDIVTQFEQSPKGKSRH